VEHQDQAEHLDKAVHQDQAEHLDKAVHQDQAEHLVQVVLAEHLAQVEHLDQVVQAELAGFQVPAVLLVLVVLQVQAEHLDKVAHRDQAEHQAFQEIMEEIASGGFLDLTILQLILLLFMSILTVRLLPIPLL
jgi:hypothetical protein